MDNLTHSLAGALLGQMGLKRSSRFAMVGCILGANAPDVDVFAPLFLPVDSIAFHRGPTHAVWGWPVTAAATVALLWLVNRLWPPKEGSRPFRLRPLFAVVFLAVLTHPFLDWLTTYAVALLAPASGRWYSANAVFIIDWVYWLLLGTGIAWSGRRYGRQLPRPGRPAQIAGAVMLGYIGVNIAVSTYAERTLAAMLRARGVQPTLVIASPPPIAFWDRALAWRSATHWGSGTFNWGRGVHLDAGAEPLRLNDPRLVRARRERRDVRSYLYWSRMPILVEQNGRAYLGDQRYYGPIRSDDVPDAVRRIARRSPFLVPLEPGDR